jgi:hypothetical protein
MNSAVIVGIMIPHIGNRTAQRCIPTFMGGVEYFICNSNSANFITQESADDLLASEQFVLSDLL